MMALVGDDNPKQTAQMQAWYEKAQEYKDNE